MSVEEHHNDFKLSDLTQEVSNKFLLTSAVARRARQLKDGAKPMVPTDRETMLPVMTALYEIHQNKIKVVKQEVKDETQEMLEKMDEELETELEKVNNTESSDDDKNKGDKKKSKSLAA